MRKITQSQIEEMLSELEELYVAGGSCNLDTAENMFRSSLKLKEVNTNPSLLVRIDAIIELWGLRVNLKRK